MRFSRPDWYTGNIPWLLAGRAARSFSQAVLVIGVPLYVSAAGYSTVRVGYLLSLALLGSTLITLFVGVFSDRYGRKPLLMVIAVLAIIGTSVFALTTQFWILAVMAAMASVRGGGAGSGGGFGPFYPAEQALIASSSSDQQRNSVFSVLSLVGVLAGALGSAVMVIPDILQRHHTSVLDSYHPIFWIAAFGSFTVLLLTLPIHEKHNPPVAPKNTGTRISTWKLIGRLWLTNGVNGLVIGVIGPFLTYWLSVRYGATATAIATLYLVANLLTAFSYLAAPAIAHRLRAVPTIIITRFGTVLLMAGIALAPTFFWAFVTYTLRIMVNSIGLPIRQSFVMGIAEEEGRSRVAAFGSLPSQGTGVVTPTIASHLMQSVSEAAPMWMATGASAVNAALWGLFFRRVRPPEEE
jgi:MFS family permease